MTPKSLRASKLSSEPYLVGSPKMGTTTKEAKYGSQGRRPHRRGKGTVSGSSGSPKGVTDTMVNRANGGRKNSQPEAHRPLVAGSTPSYRGRSTCGAQRIGPSIQRSNAAIRWVCKGPVDAWRKFAQKTLSKPSVIYENKDYAGFYVPMSQYHCGFILALASKDGTQWDLYRVSEIIPEVFLYLWSPPSAYSEGLHMFKAKLLRRLT